MFFRKRKILAFLGLAAAIGAVGAGCCHRGGPEDRANWVSKRIAGELDLTDVQKQRLDALKEEILAAHTKSRSERGQLLDQLIAQAKSPSLDQAKLKDLFEQRKQFLEAAAPGVIAKLAEFHGSLTDEQRGRLAEKLEKIRSWHD